MQLSIEHNDKAHAIEILEQNKESNPGSLTAARLCIEFAQEVEYDNELTLKACLNYAKLDSSDSSVIDRIMELLPTCLSHLFAY